MKNQYYASYVKEVLPTGECVLDYYEGNYKEVDEKIKSHIENEIEKQLDSEAKGIKNIYEQQLLDYTPQEF